MMNINANYHFEPCFVQSVFRSFPYKTLHNIPTIQHKGITYYFPDLFLRYSQFLILNVVTPIHKNIICLNLNRENNFTTSIGSQPG